MDKIERDLGVFFKTHGIQGSHAVAVISAEGTYKQKEQVFISKVAKLKDALKLGLTEVAIIPSSLNAFEKFKFIESLAKASGIDVEPPNDSGSWLQIVRAWEDENIGKYGDTLRNIGNEILRSMGIKPGRMPKDAPFIIKGKLIIDPTTRKPLTVNQWRKIEIDLITYLNRTAKTLGRNMTFTGMSLGSLLDRMTENGVNLKGAKWEDVKKEVEGWPDDEQSYREFHGTKSFLDDYIAYDADRTAEAIVQLNDRTRGAIKETINNVLVSGDIRNLESSLEQRFGTLNRDWRRIAVTEGQNAIVSGGLYNIVSDKKPDENAYARWEGPDDDKTSWHCHNKIVGKISLVLPEPPKEIDQEYYNDPDLGKISIIWPGKNYVFNQGVHHKSWRVVWGSQHPHCRHHAFRTDVETEKAIGDK